MKDFFVSYTANDELGPCGSPGSSSRPAIRPSSRPGTSRPARASSSRWTRPPKARSGRSPSSRLVAETGRRANLISIACNEILKNLGSRDRVISSEAVDAALGSWAIDDALGGWGELAGPDKEGSRLDRVLVYATVRDGGFTLEEALRTLNELGLPVEGDRLQRSLRRLELAYVLGREDGPLGGDRGGKHGRFVYQVPLFVKRILAQEPEALLENELGHRPG
jgi:hypothetical protein